MSDGAQQIASVGGIEWFNAIGEQKCRAAGSIDDAAGHLTVYAANDDGTETLLGTVSWHGGALERMPALATALTMVADEVREHHARLEPPATGR